MPNIFCTTSCVLFLAGLSILAKNRIHSVQTNTAGYKWEEEEQGQTFQAMFLVEREFMIQYETYLKEFDIMNPPTNHY